MILALWQFLYIASSRKMLFERNFEIRTKFVYFKYIFNGGAYVTKWFTEGSCIEMKQLKAKLRKMIWIKRSIERFFFYGTNNDILNKIIFLSFAFSCLILIRDPSVNRKIT